MRGFFRVGTGDAGQGFIEYIMIVGLVGIALTAVLITYQGQISTALNAVGIGV